MSNNDTTQSELERFNAAVSKLFATNKETLEEDQLNSSLAILGFFRKQIILSGLGSYRDGKMTRGIIDEYAVFNEAYIRAVRTIQKGEVINNPSAWLKRAGYYIVRETSRTRGRDRKKFSSLTSSPQYDREGEPTDETLESEFSQEDRNKVNEVMSKLQDDEARIVRKRWGEGLKWKKIAEQMALEDNSKSLEAIKKRGNRALNKIQGKIKGQ